jgi:hypothetical protein
LRHVLGRSRIADDRQGEPVDAPLEAAHEGGRRVAVAGGETRQECLVRAGHTHFY